MFKEFSLGCLVVASSLIWKKEKLAEMVTRCHSLYYALSLVVPLVVIRCHSLSFVVTRCTTRCHSLSFVVPLVVTRCHSLSLVVPLVVIRCHLSFVFTRCTTRFHSLYHSLSLVVPLACFFINDQIIEFSGTFIGYRKSKLG